MQLENYIKSELLVLIPVLYLIGIALKNSKMKDELIPLCVGFIGIALSCLWVFATEDIADIKEVFISSFTAITQGILVAGASVYANQMYKQLTKGGEDDEQ